MNEPGQSVFTGAGLAGHQNIRISGGHALGEVNHLAHRIRKRHHLDHYFCLKDQLANAAGRAQVDLTLQICDLRSQI